LKDINEEQRYPSKCINQLRRTVQYMGRSNIIIKTSPIIKGEDEDEIDTKREQNKKMVQFVVSVLNMKLKVKML